MIRTVPAYERRQEIENKCLQTFLDAYSDVRHRPLAILINMNRFGDETEFMSADFLRLYSVETLHTKLQRLAETPEPVEESA